MNAFAPILQGRWEALARPAPAPDVSLIRLAELCDLARGASRELDERIALAVLPGLRRLRPLGRGLWARADGGGRIKAPRYSSSSSAALTLVPDGHRILWNARGGGRIEILAPGGTAEIGWGLNSHFPLAAAAASLRARARLARS